MRRFLFTVLSIVSFTASAQLANVPAAFAALSTEPQVLHLKKNHIKVPTGGHLQGIQALSDSEMIITASSASYSYYLSASIQQFESIQKISDGPFRHAGGSQTFDHKLVVGIEDNHAKDKAEIVMITFDNYGRQISQYLIAHREGSYKRSTAGATGFTRVSSGRYLAAVGDWDSRNIDFYLSRQGSDTLFDSLCTYHVPGTQPWPSYQSINLLTDSAGKIYMIGFALDGVNNRADLFEVPLHTNKVDLKLLSTRNFKCRGTSFRYGSGICVNKARQLLIYSCSRNVTADTTANIFK